MFKKYIVAACLVLPLAWATPAAADTINFDPDGNEAGGVGFSPIDSLDFAEGNAIALNANINTPTGIANQFTVLYQASLSQAKLSDGTVQFTDGGGSEYFTITASFTEFIASRTLSDTDSTPGNDTASIVFGLGTGPNTFTIYHTDSDQTNALTGVCYVCGTPVLTGTITPAGFTSSFTASLAPAPAPLNSNLDQAGSNNYGAIQTITGSGGFNINAVVTFADPLYFQGLVAGSVINLANFNGNNKLPFQEVDPAACIHSTAQSGLVTAPTCTGGVIGAASVGAVNGLGTNTMFQADANASFTTAQTVVPEPASLTLLGLGLLGSARSIRRRLQSKA